MWLRTPTHDCHFLTIKKLSNKSETFIHSVTLFPGHSESSSKYLNCVTYMPGIKRNLCVGKLTKMGHTKYLKTPAPAKLVVRLLWSRINLIMLELVSLEEVMAVHCFLWLSIFFVKVQLLSLISIFNLVTLTLCSMPTEMSVNLDYLFNKSFCTVSSDTKNSGFK